LSRLAGILVEELGAVAFQLGGRSFDGGVATPEVGSWSPAASQCSAASL
jgi:hypothetical protein